MQKLDIFTAESAGSKAYNLLQMVKANLPVPQFSVYRYDLFERVSVLEHVSCLQNQYHNGDITLIQLSESLKSLLCEEFLKEDYACLSEYSDSNKTFSVRSSATLEDTSQTSFAGQFHTSLHQRPEQLKEAMLATLLSLYDVSVLTYVFDNGLTLERLEMTTIIQEMVIGELSGIYFTANPNGIISEHVVVVGGGDGSQVVEDRVDTSMLIYHPLDDLFYTTTQGNAPMLSDIQFQQLHAISQTCMSLFGAFLDIEFTFVEEQLFVLQARPITTLPKVNQLVLDNSNIVESYPGTSTPLTISFVTEAYAGVFRNLAKRLLGRNNKALEVYEPVFQNMVATVNSHFYYQISSWYQLLQILPFSKKIIPIWQDMLGVEDKFYERLPIKLSWWSYCKVMFAFVRHFISAPKQMALLEKQFLKIEEDYRQLQLEDATNEQLIAVFNTLTTDILERWDITLINDLYAFVYTGLLKKTRKDINVSEMIAGIANIESMKPARALEKLVSLLRSLSEVEQKRIRELSEDELIQWLDTSDSLASEMRQFIELYGDRGPEELKLETKTFRTDPLKLLETMFQHLDNSVNDNLPQNDRDNKKVSFFQKQAMKGIYYRESSRLNRTRIYGIVREICLLLAQRLVVQGRLKTKEDVFYLTYNELFDTVCDDSISVLDKVERRKQKFLKDTQIPVFSRLIFLGDYFDRQVDTQVVTTSPSEKVGYIQGIGCSKGVVKAQIKVVNDVHEVGDVSGKIIVTKMTDPGWVYLLKQSAGIIAEKGSLLSHTAIISRELSIPSVVGVKHATKLFVNDEWVVLNGTTGEIERLIGEV